MQYRTFLRLSGTVGLAGLLAASCAYQQRIAQGDASAARGDYAAAIADYQAASTTPQAVSDDGGEQAEAKIRQTKAAWAASLADRAATLETAGHPGGAWLLLAKAASLDPKNPAYSQRLDQSREQIRRWSDYPVVAVGDDERARETLHNLSNSLDPDASIRLVFASSAPARAILRLAFADPVFQYETHEETRTADAQPARRGGRGGGRTGFGRGGRGGGGGVASARGSGSAPAASGQQSYSGFGAGIVSSQSAQSAAIAPLSLASASAVAAAPAVNGQFSTAVPPSLGNPLPVLGSSLPPLGNPLPTLSNALPVLGTALPALGDASPAIGSVSSGVGNVLPTLSSPFPAQSSPGPAIGSGLPALGSANPAIGSGAPALRNTATQLSAGGTRAAAASSSLGTISAASANSTASIQRGGGRNGVVVEAPSSGGRRGAPATPGGVYPVTVRTLTANSEIRGIVAHGDGRPPISIDVPLTAVGRAEANAAQRAAGVPARPMEPIHPDMVTGFLVAQSTEAARRALDASFQSWRGALLAGADRAESPESKLDGYAVYALSDPHSLDPGVRERIDRAAEAFAGIKNAADLMTKPK